MAPLKTGTNAHMKDDVRISIEKLSGSFLGPLDHVEPFYTPYLKARTQSGAVPGLFAVSSLFSNVFLELVRQGKLIYLSGWN